MDTDPVVVRPSARAVMLDERDRVLLFCAEGVIGHSPRAGDKPPLWITPGGGVEPGESFEEAVVREIFEETGQRGLDIGPCVWTRSYRFEWRGRVIEQRERYYLVRCPSFDVVSDNHTEEERTFLAEHRWWAIEDIRRSRDYFVPRRIADLLDELAAGRLPAEPIDTGV